MSWRSYFVNNTLETPDYKGHGLRENEKPDNDIQSMAADIAEQIANSIDNEKFIVFGHSMGGIIAWYTSWLLYSEYKMQPEALCLSACPPPDDFSIVLPQNDYEILESLKVGSHANFKMLKSKYFKEHMLPIIRHDYQKILQYKFEGEIKRLSIPFYVFCGRKDELVSPDKVSQWRRFTSKDCYLRIFEGQHFYFDELNQRKRLCQFLDNFNVAQEP